MRNLLIPLADGTTLAADLHLPEGPQRHPTLVSIYPYRKDDIIGSFSAYARHWFAERGYAHLLVDARGYGGSEGHRAESFHPLLESADAAEVVEWTAAQEWSDGAIGVWGVSYGGLTALAAGAARPPHLKAIAPVYPLWDVRADVIALGGCPAMLGQYQWSTMMLAQALAPPTFRDADGRWLRVWHERLARVEAEGPEAGFWQAHPEPSDYWRDRVLPVERIEVPTFLVGGWRDLFPQAVAAACERISAPLRLLVGPWLHVEPDRATREPVDWLALMLRFWDEHLRGLPAVDDPPAIVFVQGAGGGWRSAASWPPAEAEKRSLHLTAGGFLGTEPGSGLDEYVSTPLVGVAAGQWDTLGTGMGDPLDQGADDLESLTFTSAPLDEPIELAGSPEVVLDVERLEGEGRFDLVAKLVDLGPNGRAELITTGWTRAEGGRTTIELWATAWTLGRGHRLRLSVSCADFPRIWPDTARLRLAVRCADSSVALPIAPEGVGREYEPPRPPEAPGPERSPWTVDGAPTWQTERDLARDGVAVTLGGTETIRLPEGGRFVLRQRATASVEEAAPEGASVAAEVSLDIDVPGGEHVVVEAKSSAWRHRHLYEGRVAVDGHALVDRSWRNF